MPKTEGGMRYTRPKCDQCQILVINNVVCHEIGCPKAPRRCKSCGEKFKSKNRFQTRCRDCR